MQVYRHILYIPQKYVFNFSIFGKWSCVHNIQKGNLNKFDRINNLEFMFANDNEIKI